jgi:hypothetical protein
MLPTEGSLSRASASYRMQQREHVCRLRAADVMRVVSSRLEAEFVYDGPVAPVWAAAEAMQKNGQRKIGLAKLRAVRCAA